MYDLDSTTISVTCMWVHMLWYLHICGYICYGIYMYVGTYVMVSTCMCVHMLWYLRVCVYVCYDIYMCVYTYDVVC